jgi:nucleotide-binding universal stress UspA family protein
MKRTQPDRARNQPKPETGREGCAAKLAPIPRIGKILAPTDFSIESQFGVRYGFALAKKLRAEVELLHVIEQPTRLSGLESVPLVLGDSEVTSRAHAQLNKLGKWLGKSRATVASSIRKGRPFLEISTAARVGLADLIVIATHGHTGANRVLLGSTAERVVRHAPCPVLTVPARATPKQLDKAPSLKIKTILVPIDFGKISQAALPWAILLASHFGARVILLHVVEKFPMDYFLGRELMNEAITPLMKQAEADLNWMAGQARESTDVKMSVVVHDGNPFEEICQAAEALAADLIVLTTHGYTGLKHVWLGSTAERVVRYASCPVLVVRSFKQRQL